MPRNRRASSVGCSRRRAVGALLCSPLAAGQWRNAPEAERAAHGERRGRLEAPPPRHAKRPRRSSGHLDARRQPLHPRSRARHRRRQRSVPAVGAPPVRRAQGRLALGRGSRRALPAARRAEDRLRVVSVEAHRDAELRRDPLRDVHVLAADLHRRAHGRIRARSPRGWATRRAVGTATRSSSRRRASTARAGSTSSAGRRPTSCASPSASRGRTTATCASTSRSTTPAPTRRRGPRRKSCTCGPAGSRSSSFAARTTRTSRTCPGSADAAGLTNVEAARVKGYLE